MLFYLIMVGMVAGFITMLFSSSKMSSAQQSLSALSMNIQGIYSGQADYSGLDNDLVIKAGIVPKKFLRGSRLENPWGGAVTVASGNDAVTFTITLEGISRDDCLKLAVFHRESWETGSGDGAEINTVAEAAPACQSGGNSIEYMQR
jgi:hypothetical protein